MNLINLKKLNAEIDELISRQDEEIEVIQEATAINKKEKYDYFMAAMRKYADVASEIHETIPVFVGSHDDEYGNKRCCDVRFSQRRNRLVFGYMTTMGDFYTNFSIGYEAEFEDVIIFGGRKILNSITNWFEKNEDVFEQRFTEACVKAIKQKAEAANARYEKARKELDETKA